MSNLKVIYETNATDIPATLRLIADKLESLPPEDKPTGLAMVIERPWELDVYSGGLHGTGAECHLLLQAGAAKIMRGVLENIN